MATERFLAGVDHTSGMYGMDLDASDSEDDDVMELPEEKSIRVRSFSSDASDETQEVPMAVEGMGVAGLRVGFGSTAARSAEIRKTPSKPAVAHQAAHALFNLKPTDLLDERHSEPSSRLETGAGQGPGADAFAAAQSKRAMEATRQHRRGEHKRRTPPAANAYAIASAVVRDHRTPKPLRLPERVINKSRLVDAYSLFGASFRASWGPHGQLTHSGRIDANAAASSGGYSSVSQSQINKGSLHAPNAKVVTERFAPRSGGSDTRARVASLEVALGVTVDGEDRMCDGDVSAAPETPGKDTSYDQVPSKQFGVRRRLQCSRVELPQLCDAYLGAVEVAMASGKTSPGVLALEVSAWDLVKTLWGDMPDAAPLGSAADRHRRRAGVSAWLRKQTGRVNSENSNNFTAEKTAAGAIVGAVTSAAGNGDPRLATLIAQSNTGGSSADLASAQLNIWRNSAVGTYVPEETSLLFEVLAGEVAPFRHDLPVDDWKVNFGLHVWYGASPCTTVGKVMDGYLSCVEGETALYPSTPGSGRPDIDSDAHRLRDVCFNLLVLAGIPADSLSYDSTTHALRQMFHPLTYCTDDLSNYSLAWHLFQTLMAVGAVPETAATAALHDRLTVDFATQLDSCSGPNLVQQWTAFVLMHLSDGPRRADAVRKVLHKRVQEWVGDEGKKQWMVEKAGVPREWLESAEARWSKTLK